MDPVQRHFPSLLMNVTFLLFFVAQLSCAKGCHRTQQTSGRVRLATELANDAVNSLHWLAGHKDSSLTRSILPSGAILVTRVFDASRQCTPDDRCVALSATQGDVGLLCLVVSRELGFLQENGCITPVGSTRLPTHLRRGAVDRSMVSGGGTTANEAGSRRNRGRRVASGLQ